MAFIKPEEVIKNFDLEPGMVVADFGCGFGHYVFEIAKVVGPRGLVYAIDVQKELLQAVKSRAEKEGLRNIEIIRADLEGQKGSSLANDLTDEVIISNILFQAEDKNKIAKEAYRILKNFGKAIVIDWEINDSKLGPSLDKRISKEKIKEIFLSAGFKLLKNFHAGENHYGIIFTKS